MVKKFTTDCNFAGQEFPVTFYVGDPAPDSHPLGFQNKWLTSDRGGVIPQNLMDSFAKLQEISEKNRLPFEELCDYVTKEINANKTLVEDAKQASALADKKKK